MNCRRIVVIGAVLASGVGVFAGALAVWPQAGAAMPPAVTSGLEGALSKLSLSATQRKEFAAILTDAADGFERLETALTANGQLLRAAELERPFDARFVNRLVARQAELMAHRRGTESRAVAEIAALLSPEQLAHFTDLRTASKDRHRGRLGRGKQPPEHRAARSRMDASRDEGPSMRPTVDQQRPRTDRRIPKRPTIPPLSAQLVAAS